MSTPTVEQLAEWVRAARPVDEPVAVVTPSLAALDALTRPMDATAWGIFTSIPVYVVPWLTRPGLVPLSAARAMVRDACGGGRCGGTP